MNIYIVVALVAALLGLCWQQHNAGYNAGQNACEVAHSKANEKKTQKQAVVQDTADTGAKQASAKAAQQLEEQRKNFDELLQRYTKLKQQKDAKGNPSDATLCVLSDGVRENIWNAANRGTAVQNSGNRPKSSTTLPR